MDLASNLERNKESYIFSIARLRQAHARIRNSTIFIEL